MAVNINVPSQVRTFANLAAFPATGALKTIYIAEDTNKTYRWTGSVYVEVSGADFSGYVPTSRTLTINGTTQDLSADRTFTISTGITIGTTAITSGTVGRVLFQGTGNVVSQSSNLFWDATNNRLGIGTSSPFGSFDVRDGDIFSTISSNANLRSRLTYQGLYVSRITDGTYTENIISTTSAWLYNSRNSHSFFRDGVNLFNVGGGFASGAMNINTNGNVLINTTTDAGFKLDVNGSARVQGSLTFTTGDRFIIYNTSSFFAGRDSQAVYFGYNFGSQPIHIGSLSTGNILLRTTGNVCLDNGASKLLIGTTTDAGFKLDVNGTARFNGNLTFQTTSWILDNSNAIMHRGGFNVESIAFNLSRMVFTDNNGFVFNGNNSAATLTASSIVDIQSTTKGFLPPRMTTTQKNAIASPAAGLMVYDTTLNVISYYNGSMWI